MNDYVAGGYAALAAILGLYAVHLRHRARMLARAVPPRPAGPRPSGPRPPATRPAAPRPSIPASEARS